MIRRLKIKFVCINMLIVTLMLAVIFGMVLRVTKDNMEKQSLRMMQSLHDLPGRRDPVDMGERLPHIVVTVNGQGIMTIGSNTFFDQMDTDFLIPIVQRVLDKNEKSGVLMDLELRYSRMSTPFGEQIVFVDTSMEQATMSDLLKTCGSIGLISFCLFFLISVFLAQWAVKPVEAAWKQQKQFVADASHELKTPLTVIMTNAELLQEPEFDEDQKQQFSQSIHVMSRQMRGLVEGLLNLARMDNGIVKTEFKELDFSELTADSLLPFEPIFFEKGMELISRVESGISVRGSDAHLRQVIDILLDNASKYALAKSRVSVTLEKQGSHCFLKVCSAGGEISKPDLKNIFKRFYRIDKARGMNQSYGLGLPIAESIVREHRGKIWAESQNGINSFHVQLPVLRNAFEWKEK